jgi:Na+-transporting NADH:ubiquinone oxidoreductase subunit NqrD
MALKTKLLSGITGAKVMSLMTQFVVRIKSLFVQTWLKIKPQLVRYLIIAVLLIKAGLLIVLQTLGHLGQKLATIARKTLQRVRQSLKLDK